MAELPEAGDYDVTIVTGDKDLIQLVDSNTTVEISKKVWLSLKALHRLIYWKNGLNATTVY